MTRILALVGWTVLLLPLELGAGRVGNSAEVRRRRREVRRTRARGAARGIGMRVRTGGPPPEPLVANHRSDVDVAHCCSAPPPSEASLDARRLGWKPDPLGFGALGAQFRHIVAYDRCFLRERGARRVDYDDRARDLERQHDPGAFSKNLLRTAEPMVSLEALDADEPLDALMDEPGAAATAWTRSSLRRELRFLASHAVHHLALIELMLHAQGVARNRAASRVGIARATPFPDQGDNG